MSSVNPKGLYFCMFLIGIMAVFSANPVRAQDRLCSRIVSLAPSITELLVELGLEPSLVGITKFDRYPPSIKQKPVVGGFLDVNTEAVIRNNPSILFSLVEGDESLRRIRSYGIRVELVDHRSLSGILDSITAIAKICGIVERGKKLVSRLNSDVARATAGVVPRKVPLNVLIVVGREVSADGVSSVYVSGRDGFYNDLLVVAGASNAYDGPTLSVPTLSSEGLKSLQPDVIIEMVGSDIQVPADDDIRESWKHLKLIPAVAQKAIFIMRNDYVTIPGPRYPLLLQDIIRVLSEVRK